VPKSTPLLPDSNFSQNPPCQRCGLPTILARMTPQAEAGRYVRSFECPNCEATFETTDQSDAEIEAMAERMVRSRSSL
jgi:hypothetical protein